MVRQAHHSALRLRSGQAFSDTVPVTAAPPGMLRQAQHWPRRASRAGYNVLICTLRNFTTPAEYCNAIGPLGSLLS